MLSRLTRTPCATFENDAKACYDQIVMNLAALRSRHLGVPTKACNMLTKFLETAEYHIKTMIGTSEEVYSSLPSNLLHGPGQGAKEASAIWLIITTMLSALLRKKSRGTSFCNSKQQVTGTRGYKLL